MRLKRRIVPTGEPCNTETVPHGSVGGRGKRSKLPRPRPTQSRASLRLPAAGGALALGVVPALLKGLSTAPAWTANALGPA
jgi:hypothetical protein